MPTKRSAVPVFEMVKVFDDELPTVTEPKLWLAGEAEILGVEGWEEAETVTSKCRVTDDPSSVYLYSDSVLIFRVADSSTSLKIRLYPVGTEEERVPQVRVVST